MTPATSAISASTAVSRRTRLCPSRRASSRAMSSRPKARRRRRRDGMAALIDSHCHLDFPDFATEIDTVVGRARAAGLERMITISTRVRRFAEIQSLVERYDDVYGSVGTHCHNAAEEDDVPLDEIVRLAGHAKDR